MTDTQTQTETQSRPQTKQPWLWNVVLLNDDDHTVEYVMQLSKDLFGHPPERGLLIAKKVNDNGRAVLLTTHKEHAELKRDQIHAFGEDKWSDSAVGAMSAIIEPAEFGDGDDEGDDKKDN